MICVTCRVDKEISDRNSAEAGLTTRIDKEIVDREDAISEIKNRMDQEAADRGCEMDDLKKKLMRENLYLKSLAAKPLSVYFDAYRTKAYDGGGEENLTFNVSFTLGPPIEKKPNLGLLNFFLGFFFSFKFGFFLEKNKFANLVSFISEK